MYRCKQATMFQTITVEICDSQAKAVLRPLDVQSTHATHFHNSLQLAKSVEPLDCMVILFA